MRWRIRQGTPFYFHRWLESFKEKWPVLDTLLLTSSIMLLSCNWPVRIAGFAPLLIFLLLTVLRMALTDFPEDDPLWPSRKREIKWKR
jgi:hypothetical protein